ncbi:GTP-binding protein [Candidatus Peregrinibacteria bacterium]|nr:GTP-binding protein [Candidatus Peregrinibacteria bacterium]
MKKVLLMGNPNVGKSVVFSRLTGVHVIASNYPGTTVEFTEGSLNVNKEKTKLIDVPGTYTLEPTCTAEKIATEMIEEGDLIINVLDASRLERNLLLTLQLLEKKKPMLVVLNMWDETKHKGIKIDIKKLEEELGVPVIPTTAVTGEGIKKLVSNLEKAKIPKRKKTSTNEKWQKIGEIIKKVQKITKRDHTLKEKIRDLSIKPLFGIPLAVIVLFLVFLVIRFVGEGLIGFVFEPLFENIWTPLMLKLSTFLGGKGFIHDVLIGELYDGRIAYVESLGLLTTGLFVPIAMVLPYVFAFYLSLSFLEDVGYLPRLAVLCDNFMHKVGLHGCSIIPMFLGLGCNVPGALATRILETKRERFIAMTLMSIAVPCMAQTAMIIGLIGNAGITGLAFVFGTLFIVWIILGLIFNKFLKGESPEIFTEIPPYRMPYMRALFKKVWIRIKWFIKEAVPYVLLGVLFVNILYSLGIIQFLGKISAPVITGILGLPEAAVGSLIVGFLRKDVAIGMLLPLGLTLPQLIVASVVLAMYFPCVATFSVMLKELGIKDMIKSAGIMIFSAFFVGGTLNVLLNAIL